MSQQSFTQLTTAGNTTSAFAYSPGSNTKGFLVTTAGVATNVTVQVEYSDTSAFTVVRYKRPVETISENASTFVEYPPMINLADPLVKAPYVRLKFVSETGGTSATIDGYMIEFPAD